MDYIKYDKGADDYADIWNVPSDSSLIRGTEYSTWKKTVTSNKYLTTTFTGVPNVCFELDYYQTDGYRNSRFFAVQDSNGNNLYYCTLQDLGHLTGEWVNCKFEFADGKVYFNSVDTGVTYSTNPTSAMLVLYGSSVSECRFKNFKAYVI